MTTAKRPERFAPRSLMHSLTALHSQEHDQRCRTNCHGDPDTCQRAHSCSLCTRVDAINSALDERMSQ